MVTVRGDPEMPLTDEDWNARETFLLGIVDLQAKISDHVEAAGAQCRGGFRGGGGGGGGGAEQSQDPNQQLCRIRSQLGGIAGELGGGGVQQGTVYPPTATQRQRFEELAERAAVLMQ
jgi:hypothetical protein